LNALYQVEIGFKKPFTELNEYANIKNNNEDSDGFSDDSNVDNCNADIASSKNKEMLHNAKVLSVNHYFKTYGGSSMSSNPGKSKSGVKVNNTIPKKRSLGLNKLSLSAKKYDSVNSEIQKKYLLVFKEIRLISNAIIFN